MLPGEFLTDLAFQLVAEAYNDLLYDVDVDDLSHGANGTSKKVTIEVRRRGILKCEKKTAFATGGQGGATQLTAYKNKIATATDGDSVQLLTALAGVIQRIENVGPGTLEVFPTEGDNFEGEAADDPITLNVGASVEFSCYTDGEIE